MSRLRLPDWPARDWRMLLALLLLGLAGAGSWVLNWVLIGEMARLAHETRQVWPLAYLAYGAMIVLGVTSLGFAMVVALKTFRIETPGGGSLSADASDEAPQATVTTTTTTAVQPVAAP